MTDGEVNELGRCHCCGAPIEDPTEFFCAADPRFDTPDGLSFCEAAYLRRAERGWPIPKFRPWDEELERRKDLARAAYGPDRSRGPRVCALEGCGAPVKGQQRYHTEACRAKAYRERRRGRGNGQ